MGSISKLANMHGCGGAWLMALVRLQLDRRMLQKAIEEAF